MYDLKIIGLFLSSFLCTAFIFLSLRCIILSCGEEIICNYYVFLSPLFSSIFSNAIRYSKRVEILLYSASFCLLKSKISSFLRIQFSRLLSRGKENKI